MLKTLRVVLPWLTLQLFLVRGLQAAEIKSPSPIEWERTVAAAKKEGQLTLYISDSSGHILQQFQRNYREIKIDLRPGHFLQEAQRAMTERRAGKYLLDVFVTGPTTPFVTFFRGKALDPIRSVLVLPEVTDQSKWFEGKHGYVDPEGQYLFLFEGTAQSYLHYNSHLVKRGEIRSYWDLLYPKWRKRIIAEDPVVSGIVSHGIRFMYYQAELGPKFLTRLFGEMDVTLSRDRRQMLDWLATGKMALCLFCYGVDEGKEQGLPVDTVGPYSLKEGASIVPIQGSIVLLNQAPHPNAAKVFINWFLSREGQIAYQKGRILTKSAGDSLRIDIPKDDVPAEYRRRTVGKYLMTARPEWMDLTPAQKLIKEARAKAETR